MNPPWMTVGAFRYLRQRPTSSEKSSTPPAGTAQGAPCMKPLSDQTALSSNP
ncbi:hypothetical protein [Methanoculleus chikugoensis]|uniref:hypothetical protein n=1 Tax=Methanoculleus chikugoensis TaxID=118126 RepID=UPI001FB2A54E|nr:hypothetical protein [Methanoculleus chikugoensis]